MQKLVGMVRRCVEDYEMIRPGDRVAVGVSGGKDSLALLVFLSELKKYPQMNFDLEAVTVDMGMGMDYSGVRSLCDRLDIPYTIVPTQIGPILFDYRKEQNPCSMCAKMRRGALNQALLDRRLNKLALGHHYDDAVETFVMNLFHEGRVGCFSPVTYLSRKDLTMIRPLIFAPEREIASAVRKAGYPIIKSQCPVDGSTQREWTKNWLRQMEKEQKGITKRLFGAMKRGHISDW